jgi:hypothetical protein
MIWYRQKIRKTLSDPSTIERHVKNSASKKKTKSGSKPKKSNNQSKATLNKSKHGGASSNLRNNESIRNMVYET